MLQLGTKLFFVLLYSFVHRKTCWLLYFGNTCKVPLSYCYCQDLSSASAGSKSHISPLPSAPVHLLHHRWLLQTPRHPLNLCQSVPLHRPGWLHARELYLYMQLPYLTLLDALLAYIGTFDPRHCTHMLNLHKSTYRCSFLSNQLATLLLLLLVLR